MQNKLKIVYTYNTSFNIIAMLSGCSEEDGIKRRYYCNKNNESIFIVSFLLYLGIGNITIFYKN